MVEVISSWSTDGCPLDFEEVQYGIALILYEITAEMITIAENMGEKPK